MNRNLYPALRSSSAICLVLGVSLAFAQQTVPLPMQKYNWKSVPIIAGGFISGIDFHPKQKDLAYVRTDIGGAYRWDAASQKWIPLQDWLRGEDWNLYGIESIGLDPSDPKKLFLACGTYTNDWAGNGAILRSSDQGRSFQRTNLPFKLGGNEDGRSIGERLAVDPNNGNRVWFGTRNSGLWVSEDGGISWNQSTTFPVQEHTNGIGTGVVVFDPKSGTSGQGSNTVFVSVASHQNNLYRTEDGGKTWAPVPGTPKGLFPHHMFLSSTGTLFITFSDGAGPNGVSNGGVWKLDTHSGEWTDITPAKPHSTGEGSFGYAGLSVDPSNPSLLVVSTLDRWSNGDDVFRSTDGGKSWVGLKNHSSRDASAAPYMTWGNASASFGWWIGAVALDPFQPNRVLYGTGANIWGSDDVSPADKGQGTQWSVRGVGIEETADIDLLSPVEGPHLITALGDIGGFTHEDFTKPAPGMTLNPILSNVDSLDSCEHAPLIVVRAGRGSGKKGSYSFDGGVSWKEFPTEPVGAESGSIAMNSTAQVIVWSTGGNTWQTFDFGKTWSKSAGLVGNAQIVGDRVTPTRLYAFIGSKLYVSNDTGGRFTLADAVGLPESHRTVRAVTDHVGDLWVPADSGLFRTVNGGKSFARIVNVDSAQSVGFGKAAPGHTYPAIYLNGKIQGRTGVFRSDDGGEKWIEITDAAHQYGTRGTVIGDPRIYGRVYLGTNGRGVFYADPAK